MFIGNGVGSIAIDGLLKLVAYFKKEKVDKANESIIEDVKKED
jgi:hypothetical protein